VRTLTERLTHAEKPSTSVGVGPFTNPRKYEMVRQGPKGNMCHDASNLFCAHFSICVVFALSNQSRVDRVLGWVGGQCATLKALVAIEQSISIIEGRAVWTLS
jgi:hypothetical protein